MTRLGNRSSNYRFHYGNSLASKNLLQKIKSLPGVVHLQHELCRSMDFILEGSVAVKKIDVEGNVLTINVFSASEILGAHLIFSTHNFYPMTVVAESK